MLETETLEKTNSPPKNDRLDTKKIVAQLDEENGGIDLPEPEPRAFREPRVPDVFAQLAGVFSSSLVVLVTNSLLSVALFFVVLIITLWDKCPPLLWACFFGFCLVSPAVLILLNVRLLIKICRPAAGSRFTIREY